MRSFLRDLSRFFALSFFLSSCAVGPQYQTPSLVLPTSFTKEEPTDCPGVADLTRWWKSFEDPLLDLLVHEAIQQNLSFQVALEKVIEMRAMHHMQAAELFPKIDVSAEQRRSRISQTLFEAPVLGPATQDFYRLGFDASWEIDLFGKLRRSRQAAQCSYEAQVEDARNVYLTLLSEIAAVYVQIRALQQQISMTEQTIFVQAQLLHLTVSRFERA